MSTTTEKSDLMAPSPTASFPANSANPSSQTNLEKDGTTEQSIKTNDTSNESKARDSPQDIGKKRSVSFRPALRSNYGSFLVDAALKDAGIIRLPLFVVEEQATAGRLVPVLSHLKHRDYGIYVVHSANRRLNKRMRMLMDALEKACQLPG